MQIILNIPDDLSKQLIEMPNINQFAEQWLRYGLENTFSDEPLNITSAFGMIKTTETATLKQIERAIQQGATDDND
jgi:hypothetical protein